MDIALDDEIAKKIVDNMPFFRHIHPNVISTVSIVFNIIILSILINNNFIGLLYKKETIFYVVNILLASLLFIDVNFSYFYMFCSGGIFLLLLNGLITNEFKLQKN